MKTLILIFALLISAGLDRSKNILERSDRGTTLALGHGFAKTALSLLGHG